MPHTDRLACGSLAAMTHRTRTSTALALATAALLALTACGGDAEPEPDPTPSETTAEPTPTGGTSGTDEGTDQGADAGGTDAGTDTGTDTGTDAGTSGAGETSSEALEQAVRDYTDAYFAPDSDTAYNMLSERCAAQLQPGAFSAMLDQAAADYGQLSVETFSVDQMSGDLARVTYTVGLPMVDETLTQQTWVREGDSWRYDGC